MDTYENMENNDRTEQPEPQHTEQPWDNFRAESVPEPEAPTPKPKKSGKVWKTIGCCMMAVVLVAVAAGSAAFVTRCFWADDIKRSEQRIDQLQQIVAELESEVQSNSFTGNGNSISGTPNTGADGLTPAQVYAQNVKSVVAVSCQTTTNIFGQVSETASSGSGFILSEDGYVVTNYHVIEGANKVTVILSDSSEYEAEVIGFDSANDVAMLKIEAEGLQAAVLGSSDDLIVGDQVVAIGNPLGELTSTLTVGFVSAKDRSITSEGTLINMIQTDAAINPGNSGGPLFNMKGEVVGITTAKYSGTTSSGASIEGIGFAIPIDDVAKKISDLKEYGYITGAYLGVMVHDMDQATAEYFNLPMGAYVKEVTKGSCAEKAGVQAKDIIVAVGEYPVSSLNGLSRALGQFRGGEDTTITVWRGGREVVLNITLDAKTNPNG